MGLILIAVATLMDYSMSLIIVAQVYAMLYFTCTFAISEMTLKVTEGQSWGR